MEEAALVVNVATFDEWYRREYRPVLALVYVLCGSRTAAEELTQDSFLEAHRHWDRISGFDDPGAWVRRVAVNKARSWGRRRAAEARAYVRHMGRARTDIDQMPEPAGEFWAAVRALPRRHAQVVALHYVEDRSLEDIATILDIAVGTVKSQLHRARRSLARTLALDIEEDDR